MKKKAIPINKCCRCGEKMFGYFDYQRVTCDKCDKELDEKIKNIIKMLDERNEKCGER